LSRKFKISIAISLHFIKKIFHHESMKYGAHEIFLLFFRVFVINLSFLASAGPGWALAWTLAAGTGSEH